MLGYRFAALILFAVVFVIAWAVSFWILWEYLYGDRHGGRWVNLTWAPAFLAACIAVGLFWIRIPLGHRLRPRTYLACLVGWIVLFAVWVLIAGNYLRMPPDFDL